MSRALVVVFGLALVAAFLPIVLACVPSRNAASVATGDTCERKGKAIIADAGTCAEAVRQLEELVRVEPTCKPFFRGGSAEQQCDGGAP